VDVDARPMYVFKNFKYIKKRFAPERKNKNV